MLLFLNKATLKTRCKTQLKFSYMLRRHEIPEVMINGISRTVPDLLADSLQQKNPYALLNMALYLAELDHSADAGMAYLSEQGQTASMLYETGIWWENLPDDDPERGTVMSWMRELDKDTVS